VSPIKTRWGDAPGQELTTGRVGVSATIVRVYVSSIVGASVGKSVLVKDGKTIIVGVKLSVIVGVSATGCVLCVVAVCVAFPFGNCAALLPTGFICHKRTPPRRSNPNTIRIPSTIAAAKYGVDSDFFVVSPSETSFDANDCPQNGQNCASSGMNC
jgi:hypothetical protein